jgi:hypothetical protein
MSKKVDYQFQVTFWNESNDLCKTINISTEYPNKVDVCNYVEFNYPNLLKEYGGEFDYYELNKQTK